MKSEHLLLIANFIAIACCLWAWQYFSAVMIQKEASLGRLKKCNQLSQDIVDLDHKISSALVVSDAGFDPSRIVQQQWEKAGLPSDLFTIAMYQAAMNEETEFKLWGARLPQVDASLIQAAIFIAGLAESEAGAQVGKLSLARLRKTDDDYSGQTEIWQVSFDDLTYLKKSNPTPDGQRGKK